MCYCNPLQREQAHSPISNFPDETMTCLKPGPNEIVDFPIDLELLLHWMITGEVKRNSLSCIKFFLCHEYTFLKEGGTMLCEHYGYVSKCITFTYWKIEEIL